MAGKTHSLDVEVVVIGAGSAGISAFRTLKRADADDRDRPAENAVLPPTITEALRSALQE